MKERMASLLARAASSMEVEVERRCENGILSFPRKRESSWFWKAHYTRLQKPRRRLSLDCGSCLWSNDGKKLVFPKHLKVEPIHMNVLVCVYDERLRRES